MKNKIIISVSSLSATNNRNLWLILPIDNTTQIVACSCPVLTNESLSYSTASSHKPINSNCFLIFLDLYAAKRIIYLLLSNLLKYGLSILIHLLV